ncbi:class I SAM-dependent methyltransferase [Streptomyces malaysiensis]|uniref:class I SAM-dependent methyltransferase n=1 Tax=Streptomyces malaysiensis TaxID=92644 RepID=UPI00202E84C1|nr:class I SAM-dependent methyltransferase [Streptomyces malaysiensis]
MTIDEASQALADLVADAGEFGPGDRILDVGFGYGDQDFRWLETCKPEKIVGVNVTQGGATALPFPDETFDKVVALESAFHFSTRDQFFAQAFRVLRPGGLLVTADVIPFEVEEKDSADARKVQSPAFRSRAGIVCRTVLRRGLRDGEKLKSELAKIDYVVAVARKKA